MGTCSYTIAVHTKTVLRTEHLPPFYSQFFSRGLQNTSTPPIVWSTVPSYEFYELLYNNSY